MRDTDKNAVLRHIREEFSIPSQWVDKIEHVLVYPDIYGVRVLVQDTVIQLKVDVGYTPTKITTIKN